MTGASRWAWALCLLISCQPGKPQPTPTPVPTVAPTPTPEPTVAPVDPCPTIPAHEVRIRCRAHVERGDGKTLWDCTPKWNGADILPEGDPNRQACELRATGGRPVYILAGATGDLELSLPQPKTGEANPFQFLLSGNGEAVLVCQIEGGFDACAGLTVAR